MKKLILYSILVFALIKVQGQTQLTLTFQAKDSITQHPLSLDSVNVRNLSENCDTTLYDSISFLSLLASWPVGTDQDISENSGSLILMQNFPNPFKGSTTVRIYLKNPGELNLAVYDMNGNHLSGYRNEFERGWHQFGISASQPQSLLLQVSDKNSTKLIKILNTETGNQGDRILYNGRCRLGSYLKSSTDTTGFTFYLGNQLLYTAYISGFQANTVLDDPEFSETYTFAMLPKVFTCGDILSYSGKNYNTVLIGSQCWFRDNLNVGTRINAASGSYQTNNGVAEKFCYDNLESNCDVYGGIYEWHELMKYTTTPGAQGLCPPDWHIPTDGEWTTLTTFLGGEALAGGPLKEAGTVHWTSPNTGATNSSDFTALPAGNWDSSNPAFYSLGQFTMFWTSSQSSMNLSWYRFLAYDSQSIVRGNDGYQPDGASVRCLKN